MKVLLISICLTFIGCSTCRGVIGVQYDPKTNIVESVLSDSPALKNDIREGDILVNVTELSGSPGKVKHVILLRNKQLIEKDISLTCIDILRKWEGSF